MAMEKVDYTKAISQNRDNYHENLRNIKQGYEEDLENLKSSSDSARKNQIENDRLKIDKIQNSSSQSVSQAEDKMRKKLESDREFYRAEEQKRQKTFMEENRSLRDSQRKQLDELSEFYNKSLRQREDESRYKENRLEKDYDQKLEYLKNTSENNLDRISRNYSDALNEFYKKKSSERDELVKDQQKEISELNQQRIKTNATQAQVHRDEISQLSNQYKDSLTQIKEQNEISREMAEKKYQQGIESFEKTNDKRWEDYQEKMRNDRNQEKDFLGSKLSQKEIEYKQDREAMLKEKKGEMSRVSDDFQNQIKEGQAYSKQMINTLKEKSVNKSKLEKKKSDETISRYKEMADKKIDELNEKIKIEREKLRVGSQENLREMKRESQIKEDFVKRNYQKKIEAIKEEQGDNSRERAANNDIQRKKFDNEIASVIRKYDSDLKKIQEKSEKSKNELANKQSKSIEELRLGFRDSIGKKYKLIEELRDKYESPGGDYSRLKDGYENKISRINQQNLTNTKGLSSNYQKREEDLYQEVKDEKKRLGEKFQKNKNEFLEDYQRLETRSKRDQDYLFTNQRSNVQRIEKEKEDQINKIEKNNSRNVKKIKTYYEDGIEKIQNQNQEKLSLIKDEHKRGMQDLAQLKDKKRDEQLYDQREKFDKKLQRLGEGYQDNVEDLKNEKEKSLAEMERVLLDRERAHRQELNYKNEASNGDREFLKEKFTNNLEAHRMRTKEDQKVLKDNYGSKLERLNYEKSNEISDLKRRHEEELRSLRMAQKEQLKNKDLKFKSELDNLIENNTRSRNQLENNYKEKISQIEAEYRRRVQESKT